MKYRNTMYRRSKAHLKKQYRREVQPCTREVRHAVLKGGGRTGASHKQLRCRPTCKQDATNGRPECRRHARGRSRRHVVTVDDGAVEIAAKATPHLGAQPAPRPPACTHVAYRYTHVVYQCIHLSHVSVHACCTSVHACPSLHTVGGSRRHEIRPASPPHLVKLWLLKTLQALDPYPCTFYPPPHTWSSSGCKRPFKPYNLTLVPSTPHTPPPGNALAAPPPHTWSSSGCPSLQSPLPGRRQCGCTAPPSPQTGQTRWQT